MKKLLLCFFVGFCSLASAADVAVQPPAVAASQAASGFPSEAERNQEGQRLTRQREALESQYTQDIRQCYQKFDVNRCRLEARDRRIEANSALRKEELRFNAMERQIHTEEARRNLAERNSEAKEKKHRPSEQRPSKPVKIAPMPTRKSKLSMNCKAPNVVSSNKSNAMRRSIALTLKRSNASATKNQQHRCLCQANEPPLA